MAFTTALFVKEASKHKWELTLPLKYNDESSGINYIVPAGFNTDLATIPWFARWMLPNKGSYSKAAVLHDWLIFTKVPRKRADNLFNNAMKDSGTIKWRRCLLYGAVRLYSLFK